jgi:hypothetical protein
MSMTIEELKEYLYEGPPYDMTDEERATWHATVEEIGVLVDRTLHMGETGSGGILVVESDYATALHAARTLLETDYEN